MEWMQVRLISAVRQLLATSRIIRLRVVFGQANIRLRPRIVHQEGFQKRQRRILRRRPLRMMARDMSNYIRAWIKGV